MKASGPKHERETIIRFDEDDSQASVWTASHVIHHRLMRRLGRTYLVEDGERHSLFVFPREFVGLPRAKQKKQLTPEAKAELAKKLRENIHDR